MKTIQNSIIIGLLVAIALGVGYFVASDMAEKRAEREYQKRQEQIRIEADKRWEELKKESEKTRAERERRLKNMEEAGRNSKFHQMLGN